MPISSERDANVGGPRAAQPPPQLIDTLATWLLDARAKPVWNRVALSVALVLLAYAIRITLFSDLDGRAAYVPFNAAIVLSAVLGGAAGCAAAVALSAIIVHFALLPLHHDHDITVLASFLATAVLLSGLIELLASTRTRMVAAEKTRELDSKLRLFIEQAPVAIAMFDRDMCFVAVSRQWIETYGLQGDVVGRNHYEIFPNLPDKFREVHQRALAGETLRSSGDEFLLPDGTPRCERWEALPWRFDDGTIGGITIFTEDITDRTRTERALRENKDYLNRAQSVARVASWRMNFAANVLNGSAHTFSLLGYPPDAHLDYDTLLTVVHEEDRERVNATRRGALKGQSYDIEYRFVVDGKPGWMRERSEPEYGSEGEIVGAFGVIQDITDRKSIELNLAASEERLRLALEAAGMAVWDWDIRTGQDVWNAQSYRMIGYEPGEIEPGFETWQRHIHPDDRAWVTESYKASIEQGADVANENRMIDRYGNVKWVAARGRAILDPAGRPLRSFGVISDITDRKQAEQRDRLLSEEVNHRAKNLLAVVQAVAIQTARYCDPKHFVATFDARLKSLAASHDLLVNSKWQGVEIEDLVRSQLAHFEDLIDHRIELQGPKAGITADAAQAIGLALHELVTNAAKYGALSSSEGTIAIEWTIEDAPEGPRFHMRWNESGGPTVSEPGHQGLGHSVLVNMARYSLGADVDLSFPPAGLVWTLNAPASLVLQPRPRPANDHK